MTNPPGADLDAGDAPVGSNTRRCFIKVGMGVKGGAEAVYEGDRTRPGIRQVKEEHDVDLEVYLLGSAESALEDQGDSVFKNTIKGLIEADVPVHTCIDIGNAMGKSEDFAAEGLQIEYARNAFMRFAIEDGDSNSLLITSLSSAR